MRSIVPTVPMQASPLLHPSPNCSGCPPVSMKRRFMSPAHLKISMPEQRSREEGDTIPVNSLHFYSQIATGFTDIRLKPWLM